MKECEFRAVGKMLRTQGQEWFLNSLPVSGEVPSDLSGALFRNGPGIFERDAIVNQSLLDGDGLIQKFTFKESKVSYQSRFVATEKFIAENAAQKFLYPTWSRAMGFVNPLKNMDILSQAGVSVIEFAGKLFACDDNDVPYEVCKETLATKDRLKTKDGKKIPAFAHSKVCSSKNQFITFSLEYGARPKINLNILDQEFNLVLHKDIPLKKNTYFHDFFITEKYIIFNLQPIEINIPNLFLGRKSFIDSMEFNKDQGNQFLIIDRQCGKELGRVHTTGSFMWHGVNAYEEGGNLKIVAIAYNEPNHFLGEKAQFRSIMSGEVGQICEDGRLHSYTIPIASDVKNAQVKHEILCRENMEFAVVDPNELGKRNKFFFGAMGSSGIMFHHALFRYDLENNSYDKFDFGTAYSCGEPVLARKANYSQDNNAMYLLSMVTDTLANASFLAIFDAQKIKAGPLAKVYLPMAQPMSFHGCFIENHG